MRARAQAHFHNIAIINGYNNSESQIQNNLIDTSKLVHVTYLSLLLPRNHKPLNYPRNSGSPSSGNSNGTNNSHGDNDFNNNEFN